MSAVFLGCLPGAATWLFTETVCRVRDYKVKPLTELYQKTMLRYHNELQVRHGEKPIPDGTLWSGSVYLREDHVCEIEDKDLCVQACKDMRLQKSQMLSEICQWNWPFFKVHAIGLLFGAAAVGLSIWFRPSALRASAVLTSSYIFCGVVTSIAGSVMPLWSRRP